jgi:hypothetical protein
VSRLFSPSKLMIGMVCSREQALLGVPQRVEGMERRSGPRQADWTAKEEVMWYEMKVVCRKDEDGRGGDGDLCSP